MMLRKLLMDECTIDELEKIAFAWSITPTDVDFEAKDGLLISKLIKRMEEESWQKKIVSKLDTGELDFLGLLLMQKGKMAIPQLDMIYREKYSFWELKHTVQKLFDKGLVFKWKAEKTGSQSQYIIPSELKQMISNTVLPKMPDGQLLGSTSRRIETRVLSPCSEFTMIWYMYVIEELMKERSNNQEGKFEARTSFGKAIKEHLKVDGVEAAFLWDMFKLWKESMDRKNARWPKLVTAPYDTLKSIFHAGNETLVKSKILGRGEMGEDNVDYTFDELRGIEIDKWYRFQDFYNKIKMSLFNSDMPLEWISFHEEGARRIFDFLEMLYIVEGGISEDQDYHFRLTKTGAYCLGLKDMDETSRTLNELEKGFLILPNFEVMANSKEAHPQSLLMLAFISEIRKLDVVIIFEITKGSLKKAVNVGFSPEDIIAFLKDNCIKEMPQNVEYSIEDWIRG